MGMIRKTLAVGALGVVRGSSKKQRVARANLRANRATTRAIKQQTAVIQAGQYSQPVWAPSPQPMPRPLTLSEDGHWYIGPTGEWLPMPKDYIWDGFTWRRIHGGPLASDTDLIKAGIE